MVIVGTIEHTDAVTRETTVTPILRDLDDVKADHLATLHATIRAHVDAHLPPSEREALAALMQRATLMRGMGLSVDEGALLALVAALGWAEDAMILGDDVRAAVAAAVDLDGVLAVSVDPATLGQPPVITAGEIAKALRGSP